jgi:hypothetical protein
MWEFLKITWDVVLLRRGIRKGQFGWRESALALGFAVLEYAIAVPAALLYEHHPQYKPLFIAAMALVIINFIGFVWLALRWRLQPPAE